MKNNGILKWNAWVHGSGWRIYKRVKKKWHKNEKRCVIFSFCGAIYIFFRLNHRMLPESVCLLSLKLSMATYTALLYRAWSFYFLFFFFPYFRFSSRVTQSITPRGFLLFFSSFTANPFLTWQLQPPPPLHHEQTLSVFFFSLAISLKVCCYLSFTDCFYFLRYWIQYRCIVHTTCLQKNKWKKFMYQQNLLDDVFHIFSW